MRNGSTNTVFYGRAEHILVEELEEGARAVEQVEVELVDSSSEGTKPMDSDIEMVVKRKMTADRFLPGGQQTPLQQAPSPLVPRRRKRPHSTDELANS